MSTLPAVLRNTLVLLAGTAAAKGLVFVSYLFLARKLEPTDFGRYSLVFAYLAFFELLPDAGLDTIVVRESASDAGRIGEKMGRALVVRAGLALVALPLAIACVPLVSGEPGTRTLVAIGALTWLASSRRPSLRSVLDAPYRISLKMGVPTALGVGSEIAHLAILVPLVFAYGVGGAVAAQGLAPIPFLAAMAWLVARRHRLRPSWAPAQWWGLLQLSAPLLASLLLNVVLVRADVLMLERLRGATEVGLYAAPVRLVEIANLLPALLMTSVFPLFAASHPSDPARVGRLFRTSLTGLLVVLVPVVLVESLAAEPIVRTLFGHAFTGAAPPLPWLAAAELFIFVDIVLTARFLATGQETRNLHCVAVAAITNVVLNLVAIPRWGAAGAAGATLVAYVARFAMSFAFRETRQAGWDSLAAIAPTVAAGAAAGAVALLLAHAPLSRTLTALAAYGVLLLALRSMTLRPLLDAIHALRPPPRRG